MTISALNVFSPSEYEKLKNLLKNPEDDFQEIAFLLEKKVEESGKQLIELKEKYHSLIDSLTHVGIGIDIVSKDHEVLFQNQVLKERFGDCRGKICYRSYMGLKEPCEFCPMEEALKYNRVERTELVATDGRSYELISAPFPNQDGSVDKVAEVVIDITDRKQAEQKLKESEEKFRNISDQSLIGIGIVQDNIVKYVNKKFADIFGYTVEDMLNWSPEEFMITVHPEDKEFVFNQVKKKQVGSEDYLENYQFRGITKSGEIIWIENFTKSIMYEGKAADFVAFIDITERISAQQELIKLNQLKSELLRRTSHELKTPLVSIKGFSELLLEVHRDKLDALVISTLNEIKHGCLRLETLIGDILKTAELESGTIQLHKSEEDLSFMVRLCVNEIKGFLKLRDHTINLELHEKLITQFEKEQIHQVMGNLLNNAIKYTPPSGIIEIKSDIKDDFIILSIKDNGIGFTEEEKTRIFKQFGKIERYGQGMDIIAEGSGFGLFISKKIIELHGGDIWVESEGRNMGSTFYFSLPLI